MTGGNAGLSSDKIVEVESRFVFSVISANLTHDEANDIFIEHPAKSILSPFYREVWECACKVHDAGYDVNIVTVHNSLLENGVKIDVVRYAEEASIVYDIQNVQFYGGRLLEYRNRLDTRVFFAGKATDAMNLNKPLEETVAEVSSFTDGFAKQEEARTLAGLMGEILQDVESGEGARPMPTPWANLNAVLKGGICAGELVVLAARPGMGKTALAGCMAVETARRFGPVLFVSCEVKDKTLGARMLAREGRIDNRAFREGLGNSQSLLPTMREAASRLSKLPLQIIDTSTRAVTPAEVRRMARRIKGGPRLIVVDYLQLMFPDQKHDSREREIAEMSRSMKRMSVELNCPVLLLSQLNRRVEENAREPQLSDLRESGAVEQDADIVIMLHADRKYINESSVPLKALVRKGRSSGTGTADLMFEKAFSDFRENDGWKEERKETRYEL